MDDPIYDSDRTPDEEPAESDAVHDDEPDAAGSPPAEEPETIDHEPSGIGDPEPDAADDTVDTGPLETTEDEEPAPDEPPMDEQEPAEPLPDDEPYADEEPPMDDEPPDDHEPPTDDEPPVDDELPVDDEPHTDDEPSVDHEPLTDDEPPVDDEPLTDDDEPPVDHELPTDDEVPVDPELPTDDDVAGVGTVVKFGSMSRSSVGSMAKGSVEPLSRTSTRPKTGSMTRTDTGIMSRTSTGSMGQSSAGFDAAGAGSASATRRSTRSMGRSATGSMEHTSDSGSMGRTSATGTMGRASATGSMEKTSTGSMGRGSVGSTGQKSTRSVRRHDTLTGKTSQSKSRGFGSTEDADKPEEDEPEADFDFSEAVGDESGTNVDDSSVDALSAFQSNADPERKESRKSRTGSVPQKEGKRASNMRSVDLDDIDVFDEDAQKDDQKAPASSLGVPGQPGGGAGSDDDENAFQWLRRVSTRMDEMGITDELTKKYGEVHETVLLEGRSLKDMAEIAEKQKQEDSSAQLAPDTSNSATQTAKPETSSSGPGMGTTQSSASYADGPAGPTPPGVDERPRTAPSGYASPSGTRRQSYGGDGANRDNRGYDQRRDHEDAYKRGYCDAKQGRPFRRGGRDGRRGDADGDRPCGSCRCCIAMRRVVSCLDDCTLDSCCSCGASESDSCNGRRTRRCKSMDEDMDACSSLTVSTGTATSCDDDDNRAMQSRRCLQKLTEDFMRSKCIRQLVLKNDMVEPGRVRSKMTKVLRYPVKSSCSLMAASRCQDQQLEEKALVSCKKRCDGRSGSRGKSPLRMNTRLLDGREICRDVPCVPPNPTRQFINSFLERSSYNKRTGKRCGKGRGKKLITISTNLRA